MKKCEVIVDAINIVVGKGSVVYVSDKQYELARFGLKAINDKKEEKPVEPQEELKEETVKETKKSGKKSK